MKKWIATIFLLSLPMLAYSGPSTVTTPSTSLDVIDVQADTTSRDTSNCINLYKPYRIVIPPGTDSIVGRVLLQDFADYLDLQVDEIYMRVRDAVCAKLTQDSLIPAESLSLPCTINADTIWPCTRDTLTLTYKVVSIKDTALGTIGKDIGSAILLYEGIGDSSTTDGVAGPEYAGFVVNRQNRSGTGDTNQIDRSYTLVMPRNDGSIENRVVPGSTSSYGEVLTLTGNSELLVDSTGNLYWIDRDWFPRMMVDTIIADTSQVSGVIVFEAEVLNMKSDTARIIDGQWGGSQLEMRFYESVAGGNSNYMGFRPQADMKSTWNLILPDTSSTWEPSLMRFPHNANEAPAWVPFDDQYVVWGVDTISCGVTTKTISISSGRFPATRDPDPGTGMPYDSNRDFWPEVEWCIVDPDSALAGIYMVERASDKIAGTPDPGTARWDELYVMSTFDEDFMSLGDPRYQDTVSFVVHVPQLGCGGGSADSIWVVRWKITGVLGHYLGTGN